MVDNENIVNIKNYTKSNEIIKENNIELSEIFSEENIDNIKSDIVKYSDNNIRFTRNDFTECMFD